jgi:1-pyrroline-5-carboxylate dehydrogenase
VLAHPSANADVVSVALLRGAFEYQGQKCSAASRAYIPASLWPAVKEHVQREMATFKMGPVEDFENFINAVISEVSFDKLAKYIDDAKADDSVELVAGGNYDKSKGWFIEPTILKVDDPYYVTMCELFGPVLTVYVYEDRPMG